MKHISISLFLALGLISGLYSQNHKSAVTRSHEQIERGIQLYDNDEYQKALACLDSVSICDPNYAWAIFESSLCYDQLGDQKKAFEKCSESYRLDPDNATVATFLGNLMDDLKKPEAIDFFQTASDKWPYNANLLYNMAVCYLNNDQPVQAEKVLLREIQIRPFHSNSHLALARANLVMGRLAQSYLAYNMAILMDPEISNLTAFENVVTGKMDSLSKPYKYAYPKGVEHKKWDDLTGLIKSQIAFNKKFEYPFKINYLTSKQTYLLFDRIKYMPEDTSLYNQFYIRFFEEIMKNELFETFIFYSFRELDDDLVISWTKKHSKELKSFISFCQKAIIELRDRNFSAVNQSKNVKMFHYNDDGVLKAIGAEIEGEPSVRYGDWILLTDNGMINERGTYLDNQVTGDWYIYRGDGSVSQHLLFNNDELDGICKTYHPNGAKAGIYPRTQGKKTGTDQEFTQSGNLLSETSYKDNQIHGDVIKYDYKDGYYSEKNYQNDKAEGPFCEKWLNGAMKMQGIEIDSLLDGPVTTWYPTSVKETEMTFKGNIAVGKRTDYFTNGIKSLEYEFNEKGELTGQKLAYNRKGQLIQKDDLYINGKLQGVQTTYFPDGIISNIYDYRNDTLFRIKSFDNSGKLIYTDSLVKGKINLKTFFPDGILLSEGLMINEKMEGPWKYYFPNGSLKTLLNFDNGLQDGKQLVFHPNGNLEKEYVCDSGSINSVFKEYYISGKRKTTGYIFEDNNDGEWVTWYSNDSIKSRLFYDNGDLSGRSIYYTPKGKKEYEEFFEDSGRSCKIILYDYRGLVSGELDYRNDSIRYNELYPSGGIRRRLALSDNVYHGLQEWFYPNGKKYYDLPFRHGFVNGISKSYDHNGMLRIEIPYVMSSYNGVIKRYDAGRLTSKENYEANLNQGQYIEYYENGRVYRILEFEDDVKQGYSYYYSPDSILMYRLLYADNMIREISWLNNMGKYVTGIPVTQTTNEIVSYFPNGKISGKFYFKDGILHGKTTTYYPNGNTNREISYNMGKFDGLYDIYDQGGKLRESTSYIIDERSGPYIMYHPNGQKHMEGSNLMNNEDGQWSVYSETGKLVETLYYENGDLYDIRKN